MFTTNYKCFDKEKYNLILQYIHYLIKVGHKYEFYENFKILFCLFKSCLYHKQYSILLKRSHRDFFYGIYIDLR